MKAYFDLHIHSCLSPCSEKEMTPNNIVNMSILKGLDIIAVTDHNSLENYRSVSLCAKDTGVVVVPGMEIETREEVHVVCLFDSFEKALIMQEKVYGKLPHKKNRPEIFGLQILMDENDNESGIVDRMLLTATDIGIDEIFRTVAELNGYALPAHIDRDSYSLLSNLGMVPENLDIGYMELSKNCNLEIFRDKHPELNKYKFLKSSDAHNLGSILERESYIEVEELSAKGLINSLKTI